MRTEGAGRGDRLQAGRLVKLFGGYLVPDTRTSSCTFTWLRSHPGATAHDEDEIIEAYMPLPDALRISGREDRRQQDALALLLAADYLRENKVMR